MFEIYNIKVSVVISILGTAVTWLFGTWDSTLKILISIIALDYITEVIQAYINKTMCSRLGLKCIAKKSTIFIVLALSVLLDRVLNNENWMFRTLVSYFYIANEGVSILENAGKMGLKIPIKFKNALIQLRNENNEVNEENVIKKDSENEKDEKGDII